MSERPVDYGREVRDTVIKSGLTGVAATAIVVAALSPAGLGGMIGTSVASGFGLGTSAPEADDPYARLPAYPSPLSQDEITEIRGELARTTASLEITRAATEAKIEHIRTIALSRGAVTYTPLPPTTANFGEGLRLATSAPAQGSYTPPTPAPTVPPPVEIEPTPVNYSGGNVDAAHRDRDLELAELLLAHEQF